MIFDMFYMGQSPMIWLLLPLSSVESQFCTDRRRLSIGSKSAILYGIKVVIGFLTLCIESSMGDRKKC